MVPKQNFPLGCSVMCITLIQFIASMSFSIASQGLINKASITTTKAFSSLETLQQTVATTTAQILFLRTKQIATIYGFLKNSLDDLKWPSHGRFYRYALTSSLSFFLSFFSQCLKASYVFLSLYLISYFFNFGP